MDPREQVQRQINEAVSSIKNISNIEPKIGIILGSGLAEVASAVHDKIVIPYDEISHFPVSTVKGHPGNLVLGQMENRPVAIMQGRFHFYEGYTMWGITFPIRVLVNLGVNTLITTGASGSLSDDFSQGDIVLLEDHINLLPTNPLIGPHINDMAPRFIDMSEPYKKSLVSKAEEAAKSAGVKYKKGVYAAVAGPQYETPAEVRMLKRLGADIVGMSIVPEVIVAKQMDLDVLGISVVSNSHKDKKSISHKEVLKNVSQSRATFVTLLQAILNEM